jgi:hypothetical protein
MDREHYQNHQGDQRATPCIDNVRALDGPGSRRSHFLVYLDTFVSVWTENRR